MKIHVRPLLFAAALVLAPAVTLAQPMPPGPPPPRHEGGQRMPFSAAEREKLRPIMEAMRAQMDALREEQLTLVRAKISGEYFAAIQKIAQAAQSAPRREGGAVLGVLLASRERARAIAKATLDKTKAVLAPKDQERISEHMSREANAPPDPGRFLAMLTMPRPPMPPGPPPPPR